MASPEEDRRDLTQFTLDRVQGLLKRRKPLEDLQRELKQKIQIRMQISNPDAPEAQDTRTDSGRFRKSYEVPVGPNKKLLYTNTISNFPSPQREMDFAYTILDEQTPIGGKMLRISHKETGFTGCVFPFDPETGTFAEKADPTADPIQAGQEILALLTESSA